MFFVRKFYELWNEILVSIRKPHLFSTFKSQKRVLKNFLNNFQR